MANLIPIISLAFLCLIVSIVVIVVRGQLNKKTSVKPKRTFVKGRFDSDNAEDYQSKHKKSSVAKKSFSAVSIAHDMTNCCEDVQALSNVRYLNKEAPLIPLRSCSQKDQCACRYVHHSDRRKGQRRNTFTTIQEDALDNNRRKNIKVRGRRAND